MARRTCESPGCDQVLRKRDRFLVRSCLRAFEHAELARAYLDARSGVGALAAIQPVHSIVSERAIQSDGSSIVTSTIVGSGRLAPEVTGSSTIESTTASEQEKERAEQTARETLEKEDAARIAREEHEKAESDRKQREDQLFQEAAPRIAREKAEKETEEKARIDREKTEEEAARIDREKTEEEAARIKREGEEKARRLREANEQSLALVRSVIEQGRIAMEQAFAEQQKATEEKWQRLKADAERTKREAAEAEAKQEEEELAQEAEKQQKLEEEKLQLDSELRKKTWAGENDGNPVPIGVPGADENGVIGSPEVVKMLPRILPGDAVHIVGDGRYKHIFERLANIRRQIRRGHDAAEKGSVVKDEAQEWKLPVTVNQSLLSELIGHYNATHPVEDSLMSEQELRVCLWLCQPDCWSLRIEMLVLTNPPVVYVLNQAIWFRLRQIMLEEDAVLKGTYGAPFMKLCVGAKEVAEKVGSYEALLLHVALRRVVAILLEQPAGWETSVGNFAVCLGWKAIPQPPQTDIDDEVQEVINVWNDEILAAENALASVLDLAKRTALNNALEPISRSYNAVYIGVKEYDEVSNRLNQFVSGVYEDAGIRLNQMEILFAAHWQRVRLWIPHVRQPEDFEGQICEDLANEIAWGKQTGDEMKEVLQKVFSGWLCGFMELSFEFFRFVDLDQPAAFVTRWKVAYDSMRELLGLSWTTDLGPPTWQEVSHKQLQVRNPIPGRPVLPPAVVGDLRKDEDHLKAASSVPLKGAKKLDEGSVLTRTKESQEDHLLEDDEMFEIE